MTSTKPQDGPIIAILGAGIGGLALTIGLRKQKIFHHPDTPIYHKGNICLMGDAAHACSPHQAAGAGQALEDALIMSRVLGRLRQRSNVEAAFRIFDSIRRPRAQQIVNTSYEAGHIYIFNNPNIKDDMQKIIDSGNERLPYIWLQDLKADIARVVEEFDALATK